MFRFSLLNVSFTLQKNLISEMLFLATQLPNYITVGSKLDYLEKYFNVLKLLNHCKVRHVSQAFPEKVE
jgi:hypothetical protein